MERPGGALAASPDVAGLPAKDAAARRPPLSAGGSGGASFMSSGWFRASGSSGCTSSYVSGSPSWGRPGGGGWGGGDSRGSRGGGFRSRRGGRHGGGSRRAGGAGCGDLTAVWLAAVARAADSTEFGDDPWAWGRVPTPTAASQQAASPRTPVEVSAAAAAPPTTTAGPTATASSKVAAPSSPPTSGGWSDWGTLDPPPSPPFVAGGDAGASSMVSRGVLAEGGTLLAGSTPSQSRPAKAGDARLPLSTAAADERTRGGSSPLSPDTPVRVWVRPPTQPVEAPRSGSGSPTVAAAAAATPGALLGTDATLTQRLPPLEMLAAAAGLDGDGVVGVRGSGGVPAESTVDASLAVAAQSPRERGLARPSLAQGPIVRDLRSASGGRGGESSTSLPATSGGSSPPPLAQGPFRNRGGGGSVSFVDSVGGREQAATSKRPSHPGSPPSLVRGPIGPAVTTAAAVHGAGRANTSSSDSGSDNTDLSPPPLSQGAIGNWPPPRPPPMALGWAARARRPATDASQTKKDGTPAMNGEQEERGLAPEERSPPEAFYWAARGGQSATGDKVYHSTEDDIARPVGTVAGTTSARGTVLATKANAAAQQSSPKLATRSPVASDPVSVASSAGEPESIVEAVDWPSPRYPPSSQDAPSSTVGGMSTEQRSPSFRAGNSPRRASSASRFSFTDPASGGPSLSTTPPSAAWRVAQSAAEGDDTSTPPLSEAVRPLLPRSARRFAAAPSGVTDGEGDRDGAGGRRVPSAPAMGTMVIVRDAATAANVPPEDWGASEARPWPAPKLAHERTSTQAVDSPPPPQSPPPPRTAADASPSSPPRTLSIEERLAAIPAFSPPRFLPPVAAAAAADVEVTAAVQAPPPPPPPRTLPQLSLPRSLSRNTAPDFLTTAVDVVVPRAGDGGVGIAVAGGGRRGSTHQTAGLAATAAGRDVLVTWRPRASAKRDTVPISATNSNKEETAVAAEPAAELLLTAHRERVVDVEWLDSPPVGGLHVLATAAADAVVILWIMAVANEGSAAHTEGLGGSNEDADRPPPLRILRRFTILPVRRHPDDYYVRLRMALRPSPARGGLAFVLVLIPSSGITCPPRALHIVVTPRGEWESSPSPRPTPSPRSAATANRPRRWVPAIDIRDKVQESGDTPRARGCSPPPRSRSPPSRVPAAANSPPPEDTITPVAATNPPSAEEVVTPAVAAEVLALPRATTYPLNPSADAADFPVESDIAIAAWEAATTPTAGVESPTLPAMPEGGGGWAWEGHH
ncbi:hypothetical protein MMPV_001995 [Pyropia vietnamensis]